MNKLLRFLRKLKYDYHYGLFDLFRRKKKVLFLYTPHGLGTYHISEGIREDALILISSDYPIDRDHGENLDALEENQAISHMAVEKLHALFAASEANCGEKILFTSTYRTLQFQSNIYGVNPYAAKPGESEHHSGLVADIKVDGFAQRRFIMSKTGKWMAKHAHEYGFVIRYPLWGEKKTHVDYEPWHLRYVGLPHSQILYHSKMVLESYLEALETNTFFRYDDTVIAIVKDEGFSFPAEATDLHVSANTRGGYVVWGKLRSDE